ncbi:glycogen debranching protein [Chryseolinea sp. T2]|uniref:glycogen debranching protein n=1 Tax=Chryseolinea sp. T2 TaxID=3129255 RepID=UPI0030780B58
MIRLWILSIAVLCCACSRREGTDSVKPLPVIRDLPSITGQQNYLQSPFVTPGNRVYMIGNQNGSFTDLGWHINGEMGGIWDHPVKLLDGFTAALQLNGDKQYCLDSAIRFVNYPVGNENYFSWPSVDIDVERFQFVPDNTEGIVVQYKLINKSADRKQVKLCINAKSDLRPTWLSDSLKINDGKDEVRFDSKLSALVFRDQSNPWFAVVGSMAPVVHNETGIDCQPAHAPDNGVTGSLCMDVTLEANSDSVIPVYISGSSQSEEAAINTLELLRSNASDYLLNKIKRYGQIVHRSAITIPDEGISDMYAWMKFNTDWLVREVPNEGIGLSAGLPDYPWWFGADATYALQGVLATGDHELVKNTILLLNKISKRTNSNGRIIHEVSTNGVVYNRGNVNETAQFITLIYNYMQWTGDVQLVKDIFPDLKKGVEWLLTSKDPDHNGYPNGSGMMEIPGLESELEMIDVAVYTQQALASAAALASTIGETELSKEYGAQAETLKKKIDTQWWVNDQQSFGDFRSTAEEGSHILNSALVRSDTMKKIESVKELKALQNRLSSNPVQGQRTFLIYNNWVVNTPMETGIASREHALKALKKSEKFQNVFGLFVTGIDKTDEPDSVVLASRKKIFSYTGAVMTLPTGVIAVGATRYGQVDLALRMMKKLGRSFSYALPGSMYEVSPDFGMITQAWNIYGVAVPLVSGIFGIHPDAPNRLIRLSPKLPADWNEAAIRHVRVGNNEINLSVKRDGKFLICEIEQTDPTWLIAVNANGSEASSDVTAADQAAIINGYRHATGKKITVKLDLEIDITR